MTNLEYELWLVMYEFKLSFEELREMPIEQFNFLARGLAKFYGGKK